MSSYAAKENLDTLKKSTLIYLKDNRYESQ